MTDDEAPWSGFPRPKYNGDTGRAAQQARAEEFAQHMLPLVLAMRGRGETLGAIAAALEQQGVATPRGGSKWNAKTVQRLLRRASTSDASQ